MGGKVGRTEVHTNGCMLAPGHNKPTPLVDDNLSLHRAIVLSLLAALHRLTMHGENDNMHLKVERWSGAWLCGRG